MSVKRGEVQLFWGSLRQRVTYELYLKVHEAYMHHLWAMYFRHECVNDQEYRKYKNNIMGKMCKQNFSTLIYYKKPMRVITGTPSEQSCKTFFFKIYHC